MNPKEPPSHTQTTTSEKPQEQATQDTSARVDSIVSDTSIVEQQGKEKIG